MLTLNSPPKNIIVRMPNWIGDAIMATPILTDLHNHWPEACITAMCQGSIAEVLRQNPNINEIFEFKRLSGWIHLAHRPDITQPLRSGNYDLGILLPNSFSSAWWFWRGNVHNRIGFQGNLRTALLDEAVPFPSSKDTQHLVNIYKLLLTPLNIPISSTSPQMYVSEEEKKTAIRILDNHGAIYGKHTIVGINPGAAFGSAKCWLPERFQEVSKKLLDDPNLRIVYFGDPAGTALVNEICKDLPNQVINLAGKTTLRELIALINSCSVFLTNDSGPMHIAAALNVPLVALFGSTNEIRTGPYGNGTVIHKHVECSPCYRRTCPIDFRCMKGIHSDEVYNALLKFIKAQV